MSAKNETTDASILAEMTKLQLFECCLEIEIASNTEDPTRKKIKVDLVMLRKLVFSSIIMEGYYYKWPISFRNIKNVGLHGSALIWINIEYTYECM